LRQGYNRNEGKKVVEQPVPASIEANTTLVNDAFFEAGGSRDAVNGRPKRKGHYEKQHDISRNCELEWV
jgi:hypothetical protein